MHGEVCLQLYLCERQTPSKIIHCNNQGQSHLSWRDLTARHGNLTYNRSTDTYLICFRNVTESFLLLEYCDWNRRPRDHCERDSTFCCQGWIEFVSRRCVNVAGGKSKLIKQSWVLIVLYGITWSYQWGYASYIIIQSFFILGFFIPLWKECPRFGMLLFH